VVPRLTERNKGTLSRRMTERTNRLLQGELSARSSAAKVATDVTRATWNSRGGKRPVAPARPGRSSTGGRMADHLSWRAQGGPDGQVVFDLAKADADAPQWIIQEIGTGARATVRRGGAANPVGRPASGASYVRTVQPQRGRRVAATLAFSSGPRGSYTPPGAARGQQLFLAVQLKNGSRSRGFRITREIQGRHFVRDGGEAGFLRYEQEVLKAARSAFAGQRRP